MNGHDVIVIGASSGGVEALRNLVSGLPADFPASVFIVLHTSPYYPSQLPEILRLAGPLPVAHARDGEAIRPGHIYVAPTNRHLLMKDGHLLVAHGPKVNFCRPAVDPLFQTAARTCGARVVGVILTGELNNGTAGVIDIKNNGGVVIVQHPDEALAPSMPRSAMKHVQVDYCLPIAEIAPVLVRLARDPINEVPRSSASLPTAKVAMIEDAPLDTPFGYTCPECHSVLQEMKNGSLLSFQCPVGHVLTAEWLLAEKSEEIEQKLWTVLSLIEERAALAHRLTALEQESSQVQSPSAYEETAKNAKRHAAMIRHLLREEGVWYSPTET